MDNNPSGESKTDLLDTTSSKPKNVNLKSTTKVYLGTTPPVSCLPPSIADLRANENLEKYMQSRGDIYESCEGLNSRNIVINKLNAILRDWATKIGIEKQISDEYLYSQLEVINNTGETVQVNIAIGGGIQLRIFGSTRLEVNTADADIDMLCIAPNFICRGDFFTSFCSLLKERDDVTTLSSIAEAYTPVVKFHIDDQAIDMIFASLTLPFIPPNLDILDDKHLNSLDEQSVRSMNGARVAECILQLVPNVETFSTALRAIKHWARQRGIYSNVLGFLGGVNFAILVAFVCQRYTFACAYTIVRKFFLIYTQWRWPNPIMLTSIEDHNSLCPDGKFLPVWNPKVNAKDCLHLMPIITPAFPAMNSSYNVGVPQFRCMQEEIWRAQAMFQKFDGTTADQRGTFSWEDLFSDISLEYFQRHPRYVQVDVLANSEDDQQVWYGWIESRIRMLILALEQPPSIFSHPQANAFHHHILGIPNRLNRQGAFDGCEESKDSPNLSTSHLMIENPSIPSRVIKSYTKYVSTFFIGLSFQNGLKCADITPSIQDFAYRVNGWVDRKTGMDMIIKACSPESLPHFVVNRREEVQVDEEDSPIEPISPPLSSASSASTSSEGEGEGEGEGDSLTVPIPVSVLVMPEGPVLIAQVPDVAEVAEVRTLMSSPSKRLRAVLEQQLMQKRNKQQKQEAVAVRLVHRDVHGEYGEYEYEAGEVAEDEGCRDRVCNGDDEYDAEAGGW